MFAPTLPTPAGRGRPVTAPPAESGFQATFRQWQRLVATELSSGQPLVSKFLGISWDTPTLAGGSERSSPVHSRPPPTGVGRVSVILILSFQHHFVWSFSFGHKMD